MYRFCKHLGIIWHYIKRCGAEKPDGHGGGQGPDVDAARQRKIAALKQRISEVREKLEDAKYEERIMRLRGTDITSRTVFTNHASLVYKYEKQLITLQSQLSQLEQMGY